MIATNFMVLLTLLVPFHVDADESAAACFRAHEELESNEALTCDTFFLTTEEKLNDECAPECQALFTNVLESCEDGDPVAFDLDKMVPFRLAFLYHEYFQNQFTSTWASCDFGYEPTQCDVAYGNLDIARSSISFGDQILYNADACLEDINVGECLAECKVLIDEVVVHCDTPESVAFSPQDNYFERTHTVLQWNHLESMTLLHFNPLSEEFAYEPLSESCWEYYETRAREASPTPVDEPELVPESIHAECKSAFEGVRDAALFGSCNNEDECSASCQALLDVVDEVCDDGNFLSVEEDGALIPYKGSSLYHEFVYDWLRPIHKSCQFGSFQPTPCDEAYGQLLLNLDFITNGPCSEDFEGGSATCSPDCTNLIDQVVVSCDVPENATFSPGEDYTDQLDRYTVLPWEFPNSMLKSGFNPSDSSFEALTQPCWDYYTVKAQEPVGTTTTSSPPTTAPTIRTIEPAVTTNEVTTSPIKAPQSTSSPVQAPQSTSSPVLVPQSTSSPVLAPVLPIGADTADSRNSAAPEVWSCRLILSIIAVAVV